MADPITINVGQTRAILCAVTVGKIPRGQQPEWESDTPAAVGILLREADRCVVQGMAAGSSTITCRVGGVNDTVLVTVIDADKVDKITLTPGF